MSDAARDDLINKISIDSEAKTLVQKLAGEKVDETWMEQGNELSARLGLKSKLANALMAIEAVNFGANIAKKRSAETSKLLGGDPTNGVAEELWVSTYLDVMVADTTRRAVRLPPEVGAKLKLRAESRSIEFRNLIEQDDWELATYRPSPPDP